jgi:hypothetical protein
MLAIAVFKLLGKLELDLPGVREGLMLPSSSNLDSRCSLILGMATGLLVVLASQEKSV